MCENCGLDIIGDYEIERVIIALEAKVVTLYYDKSCWNELFGVNYE